MENERYQKELFEFEQGKKSRPRFGAVFQKTDFSLTLSAEKIVFAGIGIMMLMVVFFALGVEKGRASAAMRLSAAGDAVKPAMAVAKPVKTKTNISFGGARIVSSLRAGDGSQAPAAMPKDAGAQVKAAVEGQKPAIQASRDKNKPYTIVTGAFLRQDFALKETSRLKAGGLESFICYSEPHYLACVGSFADKNSAQAFLPKVKQMSRDAYIRLR